MTRPENLPKRLPLVSPISNRDMTSTYDARTVNAYVEQQPDGQYYVIKRPGLSRYGSLSVGSAGVGRGVFNWRGDVYQVLGGTLYKNTTSLGSVDATAGSFYSFSSILGNTPTLVLGNQVSSYYYNNVSGLNPMTPATFIRGFVTLDGTVYYMDSVGNIRGSGVNDVTTWSLTNSIQAQSDSDFPIALAKHLVYVLALKEWTIEVFYDNANSTGSPLSTNPSAKMNIGCYINTSVLDIEGCLYFVSHTRGGNVGIHRIDNLVPEKISTPAVDRLLQNISGSDTIYSWRCKTNGHTFYVVTFTYTNLTLAYDIEEKFWATWTDPNGNYVPIVSSTFLDSLCLAQHESDGYIYQPLMTNYGDNGTVFPVDIYTPLFDGGVGRTKMISLLRFNADQTPGSVLKVRCNDNNYKPGSWTNFRTVDLQQATPTLTNCGSFRRRAYHIKHQCNTPLRIYSVDMEIDVGTL